MCVCKCGCVGRDVKENYAFIFHGRMLTENKFPNLEIQEVSVCPRYFKKDKGIAKGMDKLLGSSSCFFEVGMWGWHGKRGKVTATFWD